MVDKILDQLFRSRCCQHDHNDMMFLAHTFSILKRSMYVCMYAFAYENGRSLTIIKKNYARVVTSFLFISVTGGV